MEPTKGNVESLSIEMNSQSQKYTVSIKITLDENLDYLESEQLLAEIQKQYLGKQVTIEHYREPWPL